jgi:hypothetical protein
MSNPIKGMIAIISNYGVGKSTFALECGYHPKDICFINDDVKETGFEKDFGQYVDLVTESKGMKILDLHKFCLNLIDNIKPCKVIIWDTWTQAQGTFPAYVKSYPNEFRNPKEYSPKGSIKAGEMYQDAYRYEGVWLTKLKSKCNLLILTFHLKQDYLNNVAIAGKFRPGHDRGIEKYADLRIWLTPNPDSQVPAGLVLKNISRKQLTDKGIRTSQALPLRVPRCNWDSLLEYWKNPIGDREPTKDERPSAFELSLIEGTLTPEDKRLYEASLSLVEKQDAQNDAEELLMKQSQEKAIKAYITANLSSLPSMAIMTAVNKAIESGELDYDGEVTVAKVSKWNGA